MSQLPLQLGVALWLRSSQKKWEQAWRRPLPGLPTEHRRSLSSLSTMRTLVPKRPIQRGHCATQVCGFSDRWSWEVSEVERRL